MVPFFWWSALSLRCFSGRSLPLLPLRLCLRSLLLYCLISLTPRPSRLSAPLRPPAPAFPHCSPPSAPTTPPALPSPQHPHGRDRPRPAHYSRRKTPHPSPPSSARPRPAPTPDPCP